MSKFLLSCTFLVSITVAQNSFALFSIDPFDSGINMFGTALMTTSIVPTLIQFEYQNLNTEEKVELLKAEALNFKEGICSEEETVLLKRVAKEKNISVEDLSNLILN